MSFLFNHSSSSTNTSGTSNTQTGNQFNNQGSTTPTYTAPQSTLQTNLAQALQTFLSGNGYTPQVQALQTQSADQINQTAKNTGTALQRQFAARGFGQSGPSGQATLQTELARQGNLAQNNANFAGLALNQWNTGLQDALNFAFANPGQSATTSGTSSGTSDTQTTGTSKSSGTQIGAGVSGAVSWGG